ncbi:hypothetical protein TSUD_372890 [Trifolium subterraneum]|uniref:Helitron helicase-like domain-containing protein n=1 Tax=Trifolium subterraneum TaxID=3900 RepID=A0A2Z6PBR7_TRISU|nr:hypothetical protein TSUD_372890 [Trifolium subterraneum]
MDFTEAKIARFNRKHRIKNVDSHHDVSYSGNTQTSNISQEKQSREVSKRKANKIPLSPLNGENVDATNMTQLNKTREVVKIKPNRIPLAPWNAGDNSAHSDLVTPTLENIKGKHSKKFPPKNKYIDVRRLDFEEDTNGSSNLVNDLDIFKSTLYQSAESEGIVNFGQPEFTCIHCSAELWYEERSEKSKTGTDIQFSICCQKGKVELPLLKKPPKLLWHLIHGHDPRSTNFKDNYRAYNSMFAFTSMGGKTNTKINNGSGPPQFILSGQNYHRIGSLLPEPGTSPKFAQLYIYDTQNEVENRASTFRSGSSKKDVIDISLVKDLKEMIDATNPLAKSFRKVRDAFEECNQVNLSLRLYRKRQNDSRMHNIPTVDEVAGLIVGDFDDSDIGRDVVINDKTYGLTRIHETHVLFLPLQYPLIFPWGENGWEPDILKDACLCF